VSLLEPTVLTPGDTAKACNTTQDSLTTVTGKATKVCPLRLYEVVGLCSIRSTVVLLAQETVRDFSRGRSTGGLVDLADCLERSIRSLKSGWRSSAQRAAQC
jgi:hypothetical protein